MKKCFRIGLCLCLVFCLMGCTTDEYTKTLKASQKLLDNKQYSEAIDSFKALIELEPTREEGYLGAINTYMAMRDPYKAVDYIDDALSSTEGTRTREFIASLKDGYDIKDDDGQVIATIMIDYDENEEIVEDTNHFSISSRAYLKGAIVDMYYHDDDYKKIPLSKDFMYRNNRTVYVLDENKRPVSAYLNDTRIGVPNEHERYDFEYNDEGTMVKRQSVCDLEAPEYCSLATCLFNDDGQLIKYVRKDNSERIPYWQFMVTTHEFVRDDQGRVITYSFDDVLTGEMETNTITYFENGQMKTTHEHTENRYTEAEINDIMDGICSPESLEDKSDRLPKEDMYDYYTEDGRYLGREIYIDDVLDMKDEKIYDNEKRLIEERCVGQDFGYHYLYEYNEDGYLSKMTYLKSSYYDMKNLAYQTYSYDEDYSHYSITLYDKDGNELEPTGFVYEIKNEVITD